jgi:hypothetical protein
MKHADKLIFAASLTMALASSAFATTHYAVIITDEIPGGMATGQPFSPPVCVVHDAGYSLFSPGGMASPGLETVAREGNPTMLAAEAMASPNASDVIVGTGPFFDMQTIEFDADAGSLFSTAWMLGRTNDLFTGLYDVVLPPASSVLDFTTTVWDSGTEVNTGMIEDLGFYGHPNTGPDEDAPISMINSYVIHNDPDYGQLTWDFPPSAHVRIMASEPTPVESTTWGEVKALFQ